MNIAITGMSGTGKTAISMLLAKRLGRKLISTDEEIEKKTRLSAEKFMKKYGLERFLEMESGIVDGICSFDECIFDAGISIAMRNENITNFKKNGLIVLLTADTKTAMKRSGEKWNIELLKGAWPERESRLKKAADYAIDTSDLSPEEACDLIVHYMQMELQ